MRPADGAQSGRRVGSRSAYRATGVRIPPCERRNGAVHPLARSMRTSLIGAPVCARSVRIIAILSAAFSAAAAAAAADAENDRGPHIPAAAAPQRRARRLAPDAAIDAAPDRHQDHLKNNFSLPWSYSKLSFLQQESNQGVLI